MFNDIERKILRIICNYELTWHMNPSIKELCIKTGRKPSDVMKVLSLLNKERYIKWTPHMPDDIVILERWERQK